MKRAQNKVVYVYRKGEPGRGGSAGIVTQYKMNLTMTANSQLAAAKAKGDS